MAVELIGNRIVKTIGQGDAVKKIITEVVDGKTFTKVLDKDGKVLVDRAKQLNTAKVGDKEVKTVQKVKMQNGNLQKDTFDRVYKDGELVGRRATREIHDGDKFVKVSSVKQNDTEAGALPLAKAFDTKTGRVQEKVRNPGLMGDKSFALGYGGHWGSSNGCIHYNNKGLPVSDELLRYRADKDGIIVSGRSLKQLRNMHLEVAPNKPYARTGLKLDHLNNRQAGDNTLNDLDKFIS